MNLAWLLFEDLSINARGKVTLYHFSKAKTDSVSLDPERVGQSSFSRREMNTSSVPRVFFYLDPEQREVMFQNPVYHLFYVEVPFGSIYNLREDSKGYKKQFASEQTGTVDFHALLKHLSGWNKLSGEGWTKTNPLYKGVYYNVGFDVVAWFDPITVTNFKLGNIISTYDERTDQ